MAIETRIVATAAEATRSAADIIATRLREQPSSILGLATGRTTIGIYAELARLYAAGHIDFSRAQTLNLDEFAGLASADRSSFRSFMERHLFRHVNLRPESIHFLNGHAENFEAECARFEALIASLGGIDVQLLGIGENAHIGFNEPGDDLWVRSHHVKLTRATRTANAGLFGGDVNRVPPDALSMGIGTILAARSIVLVATGRAKAPAVASLMTGRVSARHPASFLQLHPRVTVILDRPAAGEIAGS